MQPALTLRIRPFVAELVLESVHPSQFQALPPSPWDMATKAALAGLASFQESLEVWVDAKGMRPSWRRYLG